MQWVTEKLFFSNLADVFTDVDLSNLLGDPSPNSRFGLVKRALAAGEVVRIRRGLYVMAKPYRKKLLNDLALAGKIYRPSYISGDMALAQHGFIPETVFTVTSACFRRSAAFDTPIGRFEYLHTPFMTMVSVSRRDNGDGDPYLMASPLRALADKAHHAPDKLSRRFLIDSLRIDADNLERLKDQEFETLLSDLGGSRSPARWFLKDLQAELGKSKERIR